MFYSEAAMKKIGIFRRLVLILTLLLISGNVTAGAEPLTVNKAAATALEEATSCSVSFNDGGVLTKTLTLDAGKTLEAYAPTPSGKGDFMGWYLGNSLWNLTTPVRGDMTLYARYFKESSTGGTLYSGSGLDSMLPRSVVSPEGIETFYMVKGQKHGLWKGSWRVASGKGVVKVGKKSGKVKALKTGTATLVNSGDKDKPYTCNIIVMAPVLSVKSGKDKKLNLVVGEAGEIELQGIPSENRSSCPVTFYSADTRKVVINDASDDTSVKAGVYAVSRGKTTVYACICGKKYRLKVNITDTCKQTTTDFSAGSIIMNPLQSAVIKHPSFNAKKAVKWSEGNSGELPVNKTKIEGRPKKWKNEVVEITSEGKITAIGTGATFLQGVDEKGNTLDLKVTVKPRAAKSLVFLNRGSKETLKFYKVDNKKAQWSTDQPAVTGKVKETFGKITGLKEGKAEVKCEHGGFTFGSTVYVEDPKCMVTQYDLTEGETRRISLEGTVHSVMWKSSKPEEVFVDENGVVYARKSGKTTLSTNINGKTIKIKVRVKEKEPEPGPEPEPEPEPEFEKLARLHVEGIPDDFSIYNASYEPSTGRTVFGGIVFKGERISWNGIDPKQKIVYTDREGISRFHSGTWSYTNQKGEHFRIICMEGDPVPKLIRDVDFDASEDKGFAIDGEWHPWSDLKNSSGAAMTGGSVSPGSWSVSYNGAKVTFELLGAKSLRDASEAIRGMHDEEFNYDWRLKVVGTEKGRAAETYSAEGAGISNAAVQTIVEGMCFTVKADNDGVWLLDGLRNEIVGSKRSWKELGLADWMSGRDVQPKETLVYTYSEAPEEPKYLEFKFSLSKVACKDEVIRALDGITIGKSSLSANTTLSAQTGTTGYVTVRSSGSVGVRVPDENEMGRDFSVKNATYKTSMAAASPATVSEPSLSVKMHDGLFLNATDETLNNLTSKISSQVRDIMDAKIDALLNGRNYTDLDLLDTDGTKIPFTLALKKSNENRQMTVEYAYMFAGGGAASYSVTLNDKVLVSIETTPSSYGGTKYLKITDPGTDKGERYQEVDNTQFYRISYSVINPPAELMVRDTTLNIRGLYILNDVDEEYQAYYPPPLYRYNPLTHDYELQDNITLLDGTELFDAGENNYQYYVRPDLYKIVPYNKDGSPKAAALVQTTLDSDADKYYIDNGIYKKYNSGSAVIADLYRLKTANGYTGTEADNNSSGWESIARDFARQNVIPDLARATKVTAITNGYSTMTTVPSINESVAVIPVFESEVVKNR